MDSKKISQKKKMEKEKKRGGEGEVGGRGKRRFQARSAPFKVILRLVGSHPILEDSGSYCYFKKKKKPLLTLCIHKRHTHIASFFILFLF